MCASFQSAGREPVLNDSLNSKCKGYAIEIAHSLSTRPLILSGHILLLLLSLESC